LSGYGAKGGYKKADYITEVLKLVAAKVSKESWQSYEYPLLFQEDGNKIHSSKGAKNLSGLTEDLCKGLAVRVHD
jgi:hypothetical protein